MKIVTVPNLNLREPSQPVSRPDRHLKRLLTDLQNTLMHSDIGVGLAAPQIDVHLRVFAVNLPKNANEKIPVYHYFINPSITNHPREKNFGASPKDKAELEGCLSIPHIYAPVARWPWIDVTYQRLENGQLVTYHEHFTNFASRVFQHEFDHLDGILFTDHALSQGTQLYHEVADQDQLQKITPQDLIDLYGEF